MKIGLSVIFLGAILYCSNIYADKIDEALAVLDELTENILSVNTSIHEILDKVGELNEQQGSNTYVFPVDMREKLIKETKKLAIVWDDALKRARDTNKKLYKNNKTCQEVVKSHRQTYYEDFSYYADQFPAIRNASDSQVAITIAEDLLGYLIGLGWMNDVLSECLLIAGIDVENLDAADL